MEKKKVINLVELSRFKRKPLKQKVGRISNQKPDKVRVKGKASSLK